MTETKQERIKRKTAVYTEQAQKVGAYDVIKHLVEVIEAFKEYGK